MKRFFIPFTKIDEEKREVAGRLTQEIVDRDGEIWDYAASVPHIKEWSKSFEDATGGKSVGNLRAMHRNISAGKLTQIDCNDADKAVDIIAKVVDDAEWEKTKEGVYTGFSLGGEVVRSWKDETDRRHKRFEVRPNEASLADYPCVPTALFDYVKVGGAVEKRHFKKVGDTPATPYGDVKYADPGLQADKKKRYPIDTKAHVKAALARWGQKKNRDRYSADDQAKVGKSIRAAAKKFGIGATSEKILRGDFNKGLYDVGRLAELVQSVAWAQSAARYERDSEGDESTVPDQLADNIADLLETLEDMLGEESGELLVTLGVDDDDDDDDVTKTSAGSSATSSEGTQMADKTAKSVFIKIAKKHVEKLAEIGEHAHAIHKLFGDHVDDLKEGSDQHQTAKAIHKMMGGMCEKIEGFKAEVGGLPTTETESDEGESVKIAKAEYQKVTGERDDFQKRFEAAEKDRLALVGKLAETEKQVEDLAEGVEQLTKAVEVRKGKLVAVDRKDDGQAVPEKKTETSVTSEKMVASGSVDRPALHNAFKKSFGKPRIESGMPGDTETAA